MVDRRRSAIVPFLLRPCLRHEEGRAPPPLPHATEDVERLVPEAAALAELDRERRPSTQSSNDRGSAAISDGVACRANASSRSKADIDRFRSQLACVGLGQG